MQLFVRKGCDLCGFSWQRYAGKLTAADKCIKVHVRHH